MSTTAKHSAKRGKTTSQALATGRRPRVEVLRDEDAPDRRAILRRRSSEGGTMFNELVTETASRLDVSSQIASGLLGGLLSLMMNEQTGGPEGFVNLFRCAGMGDVITS